ncbi:MAG TPA: XRE family transcriptional regulator [Syntrophomonas sp.]|jgi:transcriptional regulator with XRE-family HTH domain|nr:XRE family transcriptional regulator [Syntrophomonas sp.]
MFGSNLSRIRKQKQISQAMLAKRIGKTQQTISWYESGRVYPSLKVVENIAQALGISVEQLIAENCMDISVFRRGCAYPCYPEK